MVRNRSRSSSGFDGSRASSSTRSLKSSQLSSRLMNRLGSGGGGRRRRPRGGADTVLGRGCASGDHASLTPAFDAEDRTGQADDGQDVGSSRLPEHAQVDGIEIRAVLHPLGCLQDHRDRTEPGVTDDPAKRLQAQMPAADAGVAIDPAPALATAVVEVPDPDPADPDRPVQCIHRSIVLVRGRQGIPCRKNMAGVDANAEPLRLGDPVEDRAQVLEPMPEAGPLPRGGLEVDP